MKAACLHGIGDLRIEDVVEPVPGPHEVKIAVAHNGLCGTDVHLFYAPVAPPPGTPRGREASAGPQILGHEFAGTVHSVGPGVDDLAVGDRVCVYPIVGCDDCARCAAGRPNLCLSKRAVLGSRASVGGLAQYAVVPRRLAFVLPESVTLSEGALVEPMAVAFNAVARSGIGSGARAVVSGAGPIGIGVLLGLRAIGLTDVLAVEPSPVRRRAIEALGADAVIDPRTADVPAEIAAWTDGRGADAYFECAGVAASFLAAPTAVAERGRIVVTAVFEQPVEFLPQSLLTNEAEVVGSIGYSYEIFERVIGLMAAGAYPTDGWVEHIEFGDVMDGLAALRRGERTKLVVDISPMS